MKIDYLNKNILLGFGGLVIIILFLFISSLFAKDSTFVLVFTLTLFAFATLLLKRTNKFISGQTGEKDVEIELKKLGKDFVCINGFDTDKGNIDKIVIGPTGIWTLEVKSHKGKITFVNETLYTNNKIPEKDFLKQAYAEAKTLEDLIYEKLNISLKVQPVLVFSDKFAKVRLGMKTCKGVYVVGISWLNMLITETNKESLDQETVLKIENILRK